MKNKIAYICNTYIRNYGSILQSYALYVKLKQLGFEADIVNYKDFPNTIEAQFKQILFLRIPMLFKYSEVKKKLLSIKISHNTSYRDILCKRHRAMDSFVVSNFTFTKHCETIGDVKEQIKNYACVLIGSDQLWGVAEILRDYHTLSFVPDAQPKISYATSFGVSRLPFFVRSKARSFLRRINYLSVREKSGAELIKNIVGRDAEVVVDPTLLLSPSDWAVVAGGKRKIPEKYIFCFFLGNNPDQRKFARRFSEKVNLPIVSMQHVDEYIPSDIDFADKNINDASPNDFINLIKNAEYIICDSFHASVFSIIFKKEFYTLDRYKSSSANSRNTRLISLFSILGIENRHINVHSDINKLMDITTDYDSVHEKWYGWRKESLNYLKNSLDKALGND